MKIFWFTGLSGSGKSTIAKNAKAALEKEGKKILMVDGDEIRAQYPRPLGFTREDIIQNNRFIAGHCQEHMAQFDYIFVSVITPFSQMREELRKTFNGQYAEIYVKASLDKVVERDVKGLYKKALEGKISNFIGVDPATPYEVPGNPDLTIDTEYLSLEKSVLYFIDFVRQKERIHGKS